MVKILKVKFKLSIVVCKNSRRNRLSNILDVSQRHDVLLSLVNTLQQTTNTEYQYNCLNTSIGTSNKYSSL